MSAKMLVEFNTEDYISEDRLTQIVEEEFRSAVRNLIHTEGDVERIISNLSYEFIFKAISEEWDIDVVQMVKQGVYDTLTNGHSISYEMFRDRDFGFKEGPAVQPLKEICDELRPLMREMAEKHIREYPFHELDMGYIQDTIGEVIVDALMEKEESYKENNK